MKFICVFFWEQGIHIDYICDKILISIQRNYVCTTSESKTRKEKQPKWWQASAQILLSDKRQRTKTR